jgi:5-methylcytosine-specific restriction protein B
MPNPEDDDLDASLGDTDEEGGFYWKQGRENLFTKSGLRLFQLAYRHRNEEYEAARAAIDKEYELLSPRLARLGGSSRHGGYFSTYISFLEEIGLMYREQLSDTTFLRATPAGDQAALLLTNLPDFLKVIPYFVLELLARYRFNNPKNTNPKNAELRQATAASDIFPYWSLYRIMRSLDNKITKDELARFVFKTSKMSDIPVVIERIKEYRRALSIGRQPDELNKEFGEPLKGAIAQPKYIMGRAGFQTKVIHQHGDEYELNPDYLPFIDSLLSIEPKADELSEDAWMREVGKAVEATDVTSEDSSFTTFRLDIDANNEIYQEVQRILDDGYAGVLLVGPPGTGKTWYARQIAHLLTGNTPETVREVQFHPSYQYEDFVEGHETDHRGGFRIVDRHLLKMCSAAQRSPNRHVLIIDELSRTDPARVMGEALTYMEPTLRGQPFYLPSGRRRTIPPNLIFLGTMNPEDRSVDEIDAAMDRRWGKVFLAPDSAVVNSFLEKNGIPRDQRSPVIDFFRWVQPQYGLGHAYFRTIDNLAALQRLWRNQLQFLFRKAFRYDSETFGEIEQRWNAMLAAFIAAAPPPVTESTE